MSEERTVEVGYHKNGNKRCEIPRLNGNIHGLARWWDESGKLFIESNCLNGQLHGVRRLWWYDDVFIADFDFWHKGTLVFEFEFKEEAKALTPEPNKPIFSANQFLELCQMQ